MKFFITIRIDYLLEVLVREFGVERNKNKNVFRTSFK